MTPRTRRQKEIYDYIVRFIERHGYEPSYQQIARYFHIASKSAIAKHINALESQGLLSRRRADNRYGLTILPSEEMRDSVCEIPLIAEFTDIYSTADNTAQKLIYVPLFLFGEHSTDNVIAFRIPDDALNGDFIRVGDIALFERRLYARSEEIVLITMEDGKTTVARYFEDKDGIELRFSNDNFPTIRTTINTARIHGIYFALLRGAN